MYRGGQPGHFWPKLAGFLLLPAASSIATLVLAPLVVGKKLDPDTLTNGDRATIATLSGVMQALGAVSSWYASGHMFNDSVGTQAFFRGGMWSGMIGAAFSGASLVQAEAPGVAPPLAPAKVSGGLLDRVGDPKTHLASIVSLLSGGAIPAPPKQDARLLAAAC